MAKYTAIIKTKFGKVIISFESVEELKSSIEKLNIDALAKIISEKFGQVIEKEIRQPKPGLETVYRFTQEGLVEVLKPPESKAETIALVLYAYYPEAAITERIALSSGIKNIASTYLPHKDYRKYWEKTQDGKYVLSHEGMIWVTRDIIPKLKAEERGIEKQEIGTT